MTGLDVWLPNQHVVRLTSQLDHIRPLLITPGALRELRTATSTQEIWIAGKVFDWACDDGRSRLTRLPDKRFAGANALQVAVFNARGFLPTLVISSDEGSGQDWPANITERVLSRPIGDWASADQQLLEYDPADGALCLVQVLNQGDWDNTEPIAEELSLPEAPALEALIRLHAGCDPDFYGLHAAPQDWRAYGDGLARWMRVPGLERLRELFGLPDFGTWPCAPLQADDFGLDDGGRVDPALDYLPLRGLPFAGLLRKDGAWQVHGPLPVAGDGIWLFAPELQSRLQRLTGPSARIFSLPQRAAAPQTQRLAAAQDAIPALAGAALDPVVLRSWRLDDGEVLLRVSDHGPGYQLEFKPPGLAARVLALELDGRRLDLVDAPAAAGCRQVTGLDEELLADAADLSDEHWVLLLADRTP